jgi:hypothetical protein
LAHNVGERLFLHGARDGAHEADVELILGIEGSQLVAVDHLVSAGAE